jgi:hypothetical protein
MPATERPECPEDRSTDPQLVPVVAANIDKARCGQLRPTPGLQPGLSNSATIWALDKVNGDLRLLSVRLYTSYEAH